MAKKNGVILFALPSNSTSKLQPLDVSFFAMVKAEFKRICMEAKLCRDNILVRREHIPSILNHVLSQEKFKDLAKTAFRKTGIVPFDPSPIIRNAEKQAKSS